MAAPALTRLCAPTRLALRQAGLEYLLCDEAQARVIRESVQAASGQSASPRATISAAQPAVPMRTPQMQGRHRGDMRDVQGPRHERLPHREEQSSASGPDSALWPSPWQERLAKTRSAPVLWTYWELGRDLSGTPDPQRRGLVMDLLQELAHPSGTHSFWPVALPGRGKDGELEANATVFWEGVRLLRSRAVMIMGTELLRFLALPDSLLALRPFQQDRHQGSALIVLPAPGDMLNLAKQRMQALREFLRQTLALYV